MNERVLLNQQKDAMDRPAIPTPYYNSMDEKCLNARCILTCHQLSIVSVSQWCESIARSNRSNRKTRKFTILGSSTHIVMCKS